MFKKAMRNLHFCVSALTNSSSETDSSHVISYDSAWNIHEFEAINIISRANLTKVSTDLYNEVKDRWRAGKGWA